MRYVYLIRNLINGKVYVGQTKNLPIAKQVICNWHFIHGLSVENGLSIVQ